MNISLREDVAVPVDVLFKHVTDFSAFERSALRRGAEISCSERLGIVRQGMTWNLAFRYRGQTRTVEARLVDYEPPMSLRFCSKSDGIEGGLAVELIELSRKRTRLTLDMSLQPRSLAARLFVQTLKLSRRNWSKRMSNRLAQFAKQVEDSYDVS